MHNHITPPLVSRVARNIAHIAMQSTPGIRQATPRDGRGGGREKAYLSGQARKKA